MTARWALAIYRRLLRRLPRDFRASYGAEMEAAFMESIAVMKRRLRGLAVPYALLRSAWDMELLARRLHPPQAPRRRRDGVVADLVHEIRLGARRLLRAPAFTLASVSTLGLGIGSTVIMLSVVDSVLLRPLPYPESDRLVAVFLHEKNHQARRGPTSPVNFTAWRAESRTLELMIAATPWSPSFTGGDRPDELHGLKASSSLFELLGVPPLLGRTLGEDDHRVVVLGFDLWRRVFGEDSSIVGRKLDLDGEAYEVIGVMPEGFRFPPFWAEDAEMWAPLSLTSEEASRHARYLRVFARRKPGVSLEEAQREMEVIASGLEARFPVENAATTTNVESLLEPVTSAARPVLLLLLSSVVLLGLVACANVANLGLVRAAGRARERALAAALGASRGHRLRQHVMECLLLSFSGGLAGAALAAWGLPSFLALAPSDLPRRAEIGVDSRLLLFALVISAAVALLLALAGSAQAPSASLREVGARATGRRAKMLRDALVVSQVATSLVLLVGAGLVLRSFHELEKLDPGFRRDRILTSSILLAGSAHVDPARQSILFRHIRESVAAVPGVADVALVNHLPIGGDLWGFTFALEGLEALDAGDLPRASVRTVTPSYFRTMGIPLLAGRDFTDADDERAAPVILVNRTLAERFFSVEALPGRRIRIGQPDENDWRTVVGVVDDTRQWDLTKEISPEIYFPYAQNPVSFYLTTTLVIGSEELSERLQPQVEQAVWSVAGKIPIVNARTMESILREHVAPRRFAAVLFTGFATLALLLAAIGLYGVVSYAVSQQTVEIGIRAALGATAGDLQKLVLTRGARLIAAGLAIGWIAVFPARRLLTSLLFGVSPDDPATLALVSVFLASAALLAVYVPARRASRLDPLSALRSE